MIGVAGGEAEGRDAEFDRAFEEVVAPQLARLGFRFAAPPGGWMTPSRLYVRDPAWISVDWDWRDGLLTATVGRLFRIRDFMPSAIVRGPFHYEVVRSGEEMDAFLSTHLRRIAESLPEAVDHLQDRWEATATLERLRWAGSKEGLAGYERYLSALGPEITLATWGRDATSGA